jgi:hypothetical protein
MKNIVKTAIAIALVSGFSIVNAQVKDTMTRIPEQGIKIAQPNKDVMQQNGDEFVFVKNGVVMMHKMGNEVGLDIIYECTNGSTVATDRTLTRKDGSKVKLSEGDKVYKNGRVVPAK